jgi:ribose/xylose/arabinose/galactoside ABC-type transport system permease subunit
LLNGLIVNRIGIPSFIVTLAMLTAYRSGALLLAGDQPLVTEGAGSFYDLTGGYIAGTVPWLVIWMLGVALIGSVVLSRTKFGYHVYATGGNLEAATDSGINTRRVKLICFVFTSALCGLIAALLFGRIHVTDPTTGTGFEFRVAGAVLIGGIVLGGGRGTVYGSFVGAIIVGMIGNGLILLGLSAHHADLATGLLIMVTGALDLTIRRAASRSLRYLEG